MSSFEDRGRDITLEAQSWGDKMGKPQDTQTIQGGTICYRHDRGITQAQCGPPVVANMAE